MAIPVGRKQAPAALHQYRGLSGKIPARRAGRIGSREKCVDKLSPHPLADRQPPPLQFLHVDEADPGLGGELLLRKAQSGSLPADRFGAPDAAIQRKPLGPMKGALRLTPRGDGVLPALNAVAKPPVLAVRHRALYACATPHLRSASHRAVGATTADKAPRTSHQRPGLVEQELPFPADVVTTDQHEQASAASILPLALAHQRAATLTHGARAPREALRAWRGVSAVPCGI